MLFSDHPSNEAETKLRGKSRSLVNQDYDALRAEIELGSSSFSMITCEKSVESKDVSKAKRVEGLRLNL